MLYVMTNTTPVTIQPATGLSSRVAARIRMIMAAKRKSVKDLAEIIHLSERQAQRLHKGQLAFSIAQVEAIAEWLDVDEITIFAGRGLEAVAA